MTDMIVVLLFLNFGVVTMTMIVLASIGLGIGSFKQMHGPADHRADKPSPYS